MPISACTSWQFIMSTLNVVARSQPYRYYIRNIMSLSGVSDYICRLVSLCHQEECFHDAAQFYIQHGLLPCHVFIRELHDV